MIRSLIITGAVLVVGGVIMLVLLLVSGTTPAAPYGAPIPVPAVDPDPPSRVWSIVVGLTLAAGAGLIGIGMNRWRSTRRVV
jgi:hypothetical protein